MLELSLWPSLIMNTEVPFEGTHFLSLSTAMIQRVANILETHIVSVIIIITLQISMLTVVFTSH